MSAALLAGCAHKPQKLPVGPAAGDVELSAFYRAPELLPARPGVLIREEAMPSQKEIDAATQARRILYTSEDWRWRSGLVPVSGTMFVPQGERPAAGWPILAWAHGTLGISDVCAPSWTGFRPRDGTYINRWLKAGYAVVVTDYQGLGGPGPHPYLIWQAEGRSVLDAVRAALAARPGLLSNQIIIAGQSQGSGASLGAARLARTYAPDLDVVGAIATGLISNFPSGSVTLPARDSSSLFLSFAAGGLRDGEAQIEEIVNDKGRQLLDVARKACTAEIVQLARRLRVARLTDALSISMDRLNQLRLPVTDMPMERIGTPLFIGTGLADATLTPERQHAAVTALCAAGDPVQWARYDGHGHDGALHGSFDDSLAFARVVSSKSAVASSCASLVKPGPPGKRREDLPFNDD